MTKDIRQLRAEEMGKVTDGWHHEILVDDVAIANVTHIEPGVSEVTGVFVHPDHRGEGHGRTLMMKVHEKCSEFVMLNVHKDNAEALRLYNNVGYMFYSGLEDDRMVLVRDNGYTEFRTD